MGKDIDQLQVVPKGCTTIGVSLYDPKGEITLDMLHVSQGG